jgi:hypothetical protein
MAKRKVGTQTGSLTPDHKKSGIDSTPVRASGVRAGGVRVGGMQHTVGKLLTRPTTLLQTTSPSEVYSQSYGASKLRESHLGRFRDSQMGVPGQKAIRM